MLRNNNYQQIQEVDSSIPSSAKNLLRTQQKDIVCGDCGGISTAKVQQLLSTLEGTTQLFNTTPSSNSIIQNTTKSINNHRSRSVNKKMNSKRNNSRKNSVRRRSSLSDKKILRNGKRPLGINKIRSSLLSRNTNNKIQSKSKNNNATKIKKLSTKTKRN